MGLFQVRRIAMAGCVAAFSMSVPALSTPPARAAEQPRQRGRLFPPTDLGLLEAPDRDRWNRPEFIMDELRIFDGAKVADLGAGGGWFTLRLSRRVGPNGRVYAEDIQPQMIEAIGRRMQHEGRANVTTVLGTPSDPKLPEQVDAVLIMGSFPELEDPVALLQNVRQSLLPQALVGVVDFAAGAGGPGPDPDQRVAPATVIKAAEAAGLQFLRQEDVPPFLYLLVFGK
jgi:predicted methyltransferase